MLKKILLVLVFLLVWTTATAPPALASVSSWQKGVSIRPNWEDDFGGPTFKQSIDNLAKTNSNYATLIIPLYQDNPWTTSIYPGWNTPNDTSLTSAINYIHGKGMKVNLKIHIETYDGQWRAHINPGDRTAWFTSYQNHLIKYAKIAQSHGVAEMTIGAELINMAADDANSTNTDNWKKVIAAVRGAYSGKLTYSANWGGPGWTDEKNRIQFWPQLDYIGVSAYYPLPTNNPTVESFKQEWDKINNQDLRPLKDKFNKPILLTEVGYRSIDWAHWAPFDFWGDGNYDEQEQVKLYEALYSYWNNYEYVQGVHWWDWSSNPNTGGDGNKDFTPQYKDAEQVMTRWNAGGTTLEPTPQPPANFTGTASTQPSSVTVQQPVTITATIKNTISQAANDAIIDVEMYNSSNQQVHQTPYAGQNFASQETKTYMVNWTPTQSGMYTIKLGVFNNNWTANYLWVENAGSIQVGQGQSPTPPYAPQAQFAASATIAPSPGTVQEPETITTVITNSGGQVNDAIVDVEVHNSNNQKIHQTPYPGQNFASGATKEFTTQWTPETPGTYTIKLGVFNNNWSQNYVWVEQATFIDITDAAQPDPAPEPQPSTIQIWWPTDGATVQGAQPFKAIAEGMNLHDYKMYWQVDGGQLNEMYNSDEGYPHKEVWIDVSNWRWRDNGPYTINFVVKNNAGATLMQKEISIRTQ